MNSYFSMQDKVYDVTERYPLLLDFLAEHGFENLRNELMRKTIGKSISLEAALRSKKLDTALFEERMVQILEGNEQPSARQESAMQEQTAVRISGILPCPIRLELLEKLEGWISAQDTPMTHTLQAASMGLDWLRDSIAESESEADLADVYLSAGFSLFFDRNVMGRYMDAGAFRDLTGVDKLHPHFDNAYIDLKDPKGQYTIIGVVPAVFMVNKKRLGARSMPESWADLLKPEFAGSIALPMRDLDLFNAVLLGIYSAYGEQGVRQLGRGLMQDMHPAQMIKTGKTRGLDEGPAITVMPYFFTWMAGQDSDLTPVWPKDGAIVSPIFLLTKASAQEHIQPLVDFLFSKELGNVLSANGKFPSTHPEVEHELTQEQTFLWPGWDFIHQNDIGQLLYDTEQMFQNP